MNEVQAFRRGQGIQIPSCVDGLALKEEDELHDHEPDGYEGRESDDEGPKPSLGEDSDVQQQNAILEHGQVERVPQCVTENPQKGFGPMVGKISSMAALTSNDQQAVEDVVWEDYRL